MHADVLNKFQVNMLLILLKWSSINLQMPDLIKCLASYVMQLMAKIGTLRYFSNKQKSNGSQKYIIESTNALALVNICANEIV